MVLCYRAPDSDIESFVTNFNCTLTKLYSSFKHIIVLGDFNFPNIKGCFDSVFCNISEKEQAFCDTANSFFLKQVNSIPSRVKNENILDLIFSTMSDKLNDVIVSDEDFHTDHRLLEFSVNVKTQHLKKESRFVYNFKAANFDNIRNDLNHTNFDDIYHADNVNSSWTKFVDIFKHVLDTHIPKVRIKDASAPAWIDAEIRHHQNKKASAWRRAKKSDLPHHWATFRKLRNRLKNLISSKFNNYIDSLGATVANNPKRFWSFFKAKTKIRSLPKVISWDNTTATSAKDKATLFNNYFFSVFTQPKICPHLPKIPIVQLPSLGNMQVAEDNVLDILCNLNVSKAYGPDGISPRVLKECAIQIASPLCHIFNLSLKSGVIPDEWLKANVVPVFKKGDKQHAGNYRPVSLLCVAGKVMERAIFNLVFPLIKDQIYHLQHGFIKGRSTITQLLSVFHEISSILDNAGQVDMIYLDFSKAFDSVSHKLLFHKLQSFGFHSHLLNWFHAYLTGRNQRVIVEGIHSDWLPVLSGVPQGSILGPMLFLLYINDMPSVVQNAALALFADDSKCYKQISNMSDCKLLQNDIDALFQWSNNWDLHFHPSKCQVISITRRHKMINFDYKINGVALERVKCIRDLGLDISATLVWNDHINKVIGKCNTKLGMIKRTIGYNAPQNVSKTLYTALVRSNLEYGSSLWGGTTKRNLKLLEGVQRRATNFILQYPDLTYNDRLLELSLLPLSFRREINDLLTFFRCKNNMYDLSLDNFVVFNSDIQGRPTTRSSSDPLLLIQQNFKTFSHKITFFNRIVPIWNQLPLHIRSSPSLVSFKHHVSEFYKCKFTDIFDTSNTCTWISFCHCITCRNI